LVVGKVDKIVEQAKIVFFLVRILGGLIQIWDEFPEASGGIVCCVGLPG
jgi:hypothetical protein